MPRVIHLDDDDPWFGDQPYTDEDLKKPGFDPFEAHYAWLARRRAVTPQQEARRRQVALARITGELERFKEEQRTRPKPKPLTARQKAKIAKARAKAESDASIKLWKDALAVVKRHS